MTFENNNTSTTREVSTIFGSIAVAMILSIVFLPQSIADYRPDFVAFIVIFWCYFRPQLVGLTTAFVVGVFTDVMFFGVLGQHALAKVTIAFLAMKMANIELKNIGQVSVVSVFVLGLLLLNTAILRVVNFFSLSYAGTDSLWIGAFMGAALWFVVSYYRCLREKSRYDFI